MITEYFFYFCTGDEVHESGESCIMRSFIIFTLHLTLLDYDHIEDEIGEERSMQEIRKKCIQVLIGKPESKI
jgi:ssRNA-specific RNase YbeY (16S rRNA maturation enzyme)